MSAIILDTETHDLHGLPIQISYMPCSFEHGMVKTDKNAVFDQYFNVGQKINLGAMAVHHIIDEDLQGKPLFNTFTLPDHVEYIIGHNVYYDLKAIAQCGVNVGRIKPICTLALFRKLYPDVPHNLSAASYFFSKDHAKTRDLLRSAHNALVDIQLTAELLNHLLQKLSVQSFEELYIETQNSLIPKHISFGKYKGTALNNIPPDYVRWLLKKEDLDPFLRIGLENRKVMNG